MKVKKIIKGTGYTLLALSAVIGFVIYQAYDYTVHPVAFDKSKFPDVSNSKDLDKLTHDLIAKMSLDEKIDQMYGEPMGMGMATLGINHLMFDRLPHFYVAGNVLPFQMVLVALNQIKNALWAIRRA